MGGMRRGIAGRGCLFWMIGGRGKRKSNPRNCGEQRQQSYTYKTDYLIRTRYYFDIVIYMREFDSNLRVSENHVEIRRSGFKSTSR